MSDGARPCTNGVTSPVRSHGRPDRGCPGTRRPAKSDRPFPPRNGGVCRDCAENRGYVLIGASRAGRLGTDLLSSTPEVCRIIARNRRCGALHFAPAEHGVAWLSCSRGPYLAAMKALDEPAPVAISERRSLDAHC